MSTQRARRRQAGFSLVELMVVIAIIGILASVVLVAVTSRVGQARKTAVLTDFANIKKAIQMFKIDNGFYPDSLMDLIEAPANANNWNPDGYLEAASVPSDPWGNEYVYRRSSGGRRPYELISYGADGIDGGEEEAADITLDDLEQSRGGRSGNSAGGY